MNLKEINNKEIWENFLLDCQEKSFLDSWSWGEFQKKTEDKIWRFGVYDKEELLALALAVKVKARRGTFLFLPHGPNINNQSPRDNKQTLNILLNKLKNIAKEEKASFIRIAPIWERNEENIRIFRELGFRDAPIHIHPEATWELDIRPSEEELLRGMRKTTRYLIRQAQRSDDIKVVQSQDIKDLEGFNKIYQETAQRHHFTPFSLDYLKNQFSCFSSDNQISIFLGRYKGELVSSALVVFWQGIGFYHHGASLSKYSSNKLPVSYLVQWEAIKEAKNRGCEKYNFWGIAPIFSKQKMGISNFQRAVGGWRPISKQIPNSNNQNSKIEFIDRKHPWYGLTLFKKGFGGYKKEYLKTQDLPFSQSYWLTYTFEKLRKLKRGL